MKHIKDYLPAVILTLILLLTWECVVNLGLVSTQILPSPSNITEAIFSNWLVIWANTFQTLVEAILGLGIAIILGISCGYVLFFSSKARKAIYPQLVVTQTIPLIALAPLLLVWFGFDLLPKVIIVVLFCFFPIAIAVSDGLSNADTYLLELLKSMRATKYQTFRYVQFPSAIPSFFSGLKISSTYAVTGAVVGEYVGAYRGLGIYMQAAAHSNAIVLVFAAIFVIVILSLALLSSVVFLEHICTPWKLGKNS